MEPHPRQAILDFVAAVTPPGSPDFVPPAERIATFDNDGTLWLEKPLYIQLQHGLRAIGKAAADYARGDPSGVFILVSGLTEVSEGVTVEAFEADVKV